MKRTTVSLIAVVAVLAAVAGLAALTTPSTDDPHSAGPVASAERKPVERTTLTCPRPWNAEFGETAYTAFTPEAGQTGQPDAADAEAGRAALTAASDGQSSGGGGSEEDEEPGRDAEEDRDTAGDRKRTEDAEPLAALTKPGKPAVADTEDVEAPALIGVADGALAPGYTVQQTTEVSAGAGRGLLGTACAPPAAEFWFAGTSTVGQRRDYVHLTNPDATPAVVDVELYGKHGRVETSAGDGLTVPAHAALPVLLSTLTTEDHTNLTLRVLARSGRVGAVVEAVDAKRGADWLAASANPSGSVVLPGLPKDTAAARLVVFAPGDDDADLTVRLATPTGSISPAGHETLHVKSGMTMAVDLGAITQGEAGTLVLTPSDPDRATPVVAGLRILRGKGDNQESAFVPATDKVENRTSAAGSGPYDSTLYLTAPGKAAQLRITSSAASKGGSPSTKTVEVKAGATLAFEPDKPSGKAKGSYAVSVELVSGGPVYAARMLSRTRDGVPMFTVQPMPDDRSTVAVPPAVQDLSVVH